ncbi:MAG: DUF433 domain-containing protein [Isosphaeraceae bacterium]
MTQVETILAQIAKLDQAEREKLLVALSPELLSFSGTSRSGQSQSFSPVDFPLIVETPGVCGGAARLIRTRIPVWVLERMRQLGVSADEILRNYPTLERADLLQAWSYADRHREKIEQEIRENEEE